MCGGGSAHNAKQGREEEEGKEEIRAAGCRTLRASKTTASKYHHTRTHKESVLLLLYPFLFAANLFGAAEEGRQSPALVNSVGAFQCPAEVMR